MFIQAVHLTGSKMRCLMLVSASNYIHTSNFISIKKLFYCRKSVYFYVSNDLNNNQIIKCQNISETMFNIQDTFQCRGKCTIKVLTLVNHFKS